jgi:hypothetical protein
LKTKTLFVVFATIPEALVKAVPNKTRHGCLRSLFCLGASIGLSVTLVTPATATLVGHWTFDKTDNPWEETSGFSPAGIHDGDPINHATWSAEGRVGSLTGGSLDLTAGGCGLRVKNTSLSQAEVQELLPNVAPPKLTTRYAAATGLRLAWPAASTGFKLQKTTGLPNAWSDSGLTVTVEGSENAAYATLTGTAQFFRLVK